MFSDCTFQKEDNPFVYSAAAKVIAHGSGHTLRKLDHTCSDLEMCSVKVLVPKANAQNLFSFLRAVVKSLVFFAEFAKLLSGSGLRHKY